jgi:predicted unusual protein kinase regulating ubiquinone biosynthesis (AarF/ABC1/UbiB family)
VAKKVQAATRRRIVEAAKRLFRTRGFELATTREIERMFALETDYESEARFLRQGRALFREDDQIVVPRVYDDHSTRRVLTMEYLDGENFYEFLAGKPSREARNHVGRLCATAMARLLHAGRMEYGDPHPGNVRLLRDGRLGLVDCGCMRPFNDEEWEYLRRADRACLGAVATRWSR